MALSIEEKESIKNSFDIISDYLEGDGLASDVRPCLDKIEEIITPHLLVDGPDADTLRSAVEIFSSFADIHTRTNRMMYAADCYDRAIGYAARLYQDFGEVDEDASDILYSALRAHNYYLDDDCEDIRALASVYLSEEAIESVFSRMDSIRNHLIHDPVELTDEYLAVIDEVEVRIDEERECFGFGSCHHVWMLKQDFLRERGVVWHKPSELNPRVRFD